MYKLIVVDDEDEVREGIRLKTDWSACGFELAGDYCNGRDALEAVELLRPDVIITDICMPFMDGLELAQNVVSRYRDIRIVIVTGYEHFEYAQQAIKLKVHDYLLKPVNLSELTEFLRRMRRELDEERAKREDLSLLRLRLNESLPLLRERFLERMVTTVLSESEIASKLQYFQLDLAGQAYVALVADLDDNGSRGSAETAVEIPDQGELYRFAVFNIFEEIFAKERGGAAFRTRDDKIGLLLCGDRGELETVAQTAAEQARYAAQKYLRSSVSIGIGRICMLRSELNQSYKEASSALEYRFLYGRGRLLSIQDMEYGKPEGRPEYGEFEKKLTAALKTGKADLVSDTLEHGFNQLRLAASPPRRCYASAHRLLVVLINMITDAGFDDEELFGEDPFSKIPPIQTMDDLQSWLDLNCRRVIAFLSERRAGLSQRQMNEAIAYIHDHFSDPELSLAQVCQYVYLSTSYFSALFKQHAGCTFVEYVTRLRIDKAKELLTLTRLKSYDIAAKVGYVDPQYFSVIFKRMTGFTSKAYRASLKERP
ncbi:HTH-type transcriptional regulator YesS [compost metagenome]